jgi:ESCRT-II complex subunit VPS36
MVLGSMRGMTESEVASLSIFLRLTAFERKYKIPNYQQGYAYLTSLRICYVDERHPRERSIAFDLRDIERIEYQVCAKPERECAHSNPPQAGFLKSSPKVTLHPRLLRSGRGFKPHADSGATVEAASSSSPVSRANSPFSPSRLSTPLPPTNATWICPICSFSNPVPSNFEPSTANASNPVAPCLACGIKPPFAVVLKAAVVALSKRDLPQSPDLHLLSNSSTISGPSSDTMKAENTITCPRCTFLNHISLPACEICGAPLRAEQEPRPKINGVAPSRRAESPGPQSAELDLNDKAELTTIKVSFRAGGDKVFHDRLKGALTQRKWLLQSAPPIPSPSPLLSTDKLYNELGSDPSAIRRPISTPVGIAGLERRGLESRKNNEVVIGGAFKDLEALMASAKDIVALAEKFAADSGRGVSDASTVFSDSAAALGMITTRDKLNSGSDNLYLSELSRNLAEYLTDDRTGILRAEGGIMSLVDLWAVFNRTRNGVELVSPLDFHRAAQLWEKLGLPVRLRRFKSGLLVVQRPDWNDEKTIRQFKAWLLQLCQIPPEEEVPWEWSRFGCGINAQETAQRFGWSVGVATEELEMAEDKGVLCREEGIEGLRFWSNYLIEDAPAASQ